ncbi:hypothetical protein [Paraburkholderia susongensis]|uniref:Uncharacterized protein n=1 Tax=Paraburkholderia susongensis TaxID=1515439 RepID=A0A1X7LQX3_9BURK|nr:hypothetical protein [Paraburkholderia susongensis]SMG56235.1 hypothetical protein SAMN06265784_10899 [Paraburkholderia susongensis]
MATDSDDTDLSQSAAEGPDSGFDADGPPATAAAPPRFGRLALCVAAAGALAFGVMGTVAYGVWFNHDQQTYTEAIAGARKALGGPGVSGASGVVVPVQAARSHGQPAALAGTTTSAGPVQGRQGGKSVAVTAAAPATSNATNATNTATQVVSARPPTVAAPGTAPAAATLAAAATPVAPSATLEAQGEEGSKDAVWSGQVRQKLAGANPPAPVTPPARLADASPEISPNTLPDTPAASIAPASSPRSTQYVADSADSTNSTDSATQSAAGSPARDMRDARPVPPERRASSSNAKHRGNLFARVGAFFRRVSYRQHGSRRQQQDTYSHP